jgi:hypothetical protein
MNTEPWERRAKQLKAFLSSPLLLGLASIPVFLSASCTLSARDDPGLSRIAHLPNQSSLTTAKLTSKHRAPARREVSW